MSGPLRLRHRVLEAIRRNALWTPGRPVVVAVSGGRDSMVMMDVLVETRDAHGGLLSVWTVDHGQRPGSRDDAIFVVEQAEARGLDARMVVVEPTGADEASLREARHEVFAQALASGAVVALGHHRRDQAETVLLQLLRGGGVRARRGMLPARRGLVRPLLDEAPEALAAWAEARGLPWREDPTNASREPLRNRVRHEVLPLLEAARAGAERTLARGARLAALDEDFLDGRARELPLTVAALREAHPALVRRRLRIQWPSLGAGRVDGLMRAIAAGAGSVDVGGGRSLSVRDGCIRAGPVGGPSVVVTDFPSAPPGPEDLP